MKLMYGSWGPPYLVLDLYLVLLSTSLQANISTARHNDARYKRNISVRQHGVQVIVVYGAGNMNQPTPLHVQKFPTLLAPLKQT